VVGRELSTLAVRILDDAMADDLARYARATVDPRWYDQLDEAGAR
jgi:hypothetical protein